MKAGENTIPQIPNLNEFMNSKLVEAYWQLLCIDPKVAKNYHDNFLIPTLYPESKGHDFVPEEPNQAAFPQDAEAKQKLIDKVFEYVAPSGVVTAVLASGELVGSTIWGISKYVSKDIIWDPLGATTAAVILQSAELVGYRNEVQKFFGIKPAEKRATVAIKMGSKLGQAIGAVAGTSLTLLAEPWILPVAPVLAPYLPFAGLFIGGVAGDVIGAGLGAGFNNLLLSTIGTVPASYKGIKQKGGKFADRIKNSSAEKRKVKEAKAVPKVKKEAEQNVVTLNVEGVGSSKVPSAQLLLEASNAIPANPPYPNAAEQQKSAAQEQKGAEKNVVTDARKKKRGKKHSRKEGQELQSVNEEGEEWHKVPTQKELNAEKKQKKLEAEEKRKEAEGLKNQQNNPKKKQSQELHRGKNNGPTGYPDVKIRFPKNPGVDNNKLENVEKQNNTQYESKKFTGKILPRNAVQNARKQGEQHKSKPHAGKPYNTLARNLQPHGKSRSNNY